MAVCFMMVGGIVVPETDVFTIPLSDDTISEVFNLQYSEWMKSKTSLKINIQDMEWKEKAKTANLPRVPTLADPQQTADDGRGNPNRYNPNQPMQRPMQDPNAYHRQQGIPQTPTSASYDGQQGPSTGPNLGPSPRLPGAGGNGYPNYAPIGSAGNGFQNPGFANPVGGSGYSAQRAISATPIQNLNTYINNSNGSQIARQFGLDPFANTPTKQYSNYQAPSGSSPWNNLYLPSNNGTTNPYSAYVRPNMEQAAVNAHISEQINGVQMQQRMYYQGTGGFEQPVNGAGLANPAGYINFPVH
jgi:hypothetical protein